MAKNPQDRLGAKGGLLEIKSHPWLADVDWENKKKLNEKPLWAPSLRSGNSDTEYVNTPIDKGIRDIKIVNGEIANNPLPSHIREDLLIESDMDQEPGGGLNLCFQDPDGTTYLDLCKAEEELQGRGKLGGVTFPSQPLSVVQHPSSKTPAYIFKGYEFIQEEEMKEHPIVVAAAAYRHRVESMSQTHIKQFALEVPNDQKEDRPKRRCIFSTEELDFLTTATTRAGENFNERELKALKAMQERDAKKTKVKHGKENQAEGSEENKEPATRQEEDGSKKPDQEPKPKPKPE